MPYIRFAEEQKQQANSMDLEEFLLHNGKELLPSSREKRMAGDHSVTIRGSEWCDYEAAITVGSLAMPIGGAAPAAAEERASIK